MSRKMAKLIKIMKLIRLEGYSKDLETMACALGPFYAYNFAIRVDGSDKYRCAKVACRSPNASYWFLKQSTNLSCETMYVLYGGIIKDKGVAEKYIKDNTKLIKEFREVFTRKNNAWIKLIDELMIKNIIL